MVVYKVEFQYILCFGSRIGNFETNRKIGEFQYILCFGSSSLPEYEENKEVVFQYILCFGSSYTCSYCSNCKWRVSIHPMFRFKSSSLSMTPDGRVCFNTSYVSVQVNLTGIYLLIISVSIHPMFRFKRKVLVLRCLC